MKIRPNHFDELVDDIDNKGRIESQWSDVCKSCSNKLDNRFKYNLEDHSSADHWCLIEDCKHLADFYITFYKQG